LSNRPVRRSATIAASSPGNTTTPAVGSRQVATTAGSGSVQGAGGVLGAVLGEGGIDGPGGAEGNCGAISAASGVGVGPNSLGLSCGNCAQAASVDTASTDTAARRAHLAAPLLYPSTPAGYGHRRERLVSALARHGRGVTERASSTDLVLVHGNV